jgi:23S rRNA (pseudouridine1915-N3)-methyltransferase
VRILCLTVGKKHSEELVAAINLYEKRLKPYAEFSFELIPSSDVTKESAAMLSRLKLTDKVIVLDESGAHYKTPELAALLQRYAVDPQSKRIVIIIGGAYGVDQALKDRADALVSLSSLVFPHQLVRLILVEQLYRCCNLLAGGKYHHE